MHRCYNYRHRSTTKSEVFASVRNSHMTSQLAAEEHSFLLKWQFKFSHEHNDSLNLTSIRCKHCHRCYNCIAIEWNSKFLLPWEILTELHNSLPKNIPFFQNDNLTFLMNTIIRSILTLFTSYYHRHRHYRGIIQIFELRIFNFLKAYVTSSAYETWGTFQSTKITGSNFRNFRWSNWMRQTASQDSRSHALQYRACWGKRTSETLSKSQNLI